MNKSRKYSHDDITEVLSHESNPKGSSDVNKESVMDRITDELNNPSEETERRFQEYIANN